MNPVPESENPSESVAVAESRSAWSQIVGALRGEQFDYTQGRMPRAILLLAVPMVLEMMMESVFAVVDAYFVAKLGDAAVAAVMLTESMLTIVYAVAIGVAMSATALVARRIGERNVEGAVRAGTQTVALGVLIGAAIGVPCAFFAPNLLGAMGASEAVVAEGSTFARILLGTNVVIVLLFLNNAVFRGAGDAALAMRTLWIANGINLVLDPCLIFGLGPFPELGVTGAAVATTIGRGTGVLFQLWMLRRGVGRIRLAGPSCRIEPSIMRELLRLSVGGVLQFLIATASWVCLMRIVAPFGDTVVSGYGLAIRVLMFTILPAWGLSNAAATLVGQNLGAGRPERAEQAVWLTGLYNMLFLGGVAAVMLTLGPEILGLVTDRPATIAAGADALRIISYGYVFYAWGMVMVQAFNGAGDTMTPTRVNFVCFWLVQIPMAFLLARPAGLGPSGVYWSVAAAETLIAVVCVVLFRRGAWKETRLAPDAAPAGGEG
ncbi:MAG: MATE family efflux transporter [Planctomycetota bacterium JB042]